MKTTAKAPCPIRSFLLYSKSPTTSIIPRGHEALKIQELGGGGMRRKEKEGRPEGATPSSHQQPAWWMGRTGCSRAGEWVASLSWLLPRDEGGAAAIMRLREAQAAPPGKGGRGILADSSGFPKATRFSWHGGKKAGGWVKTCRWGGRASWGGGRGQS